MQGYHTEQKQIIITKKTSQDYFQLIFNFQQNKYCFECNKKSKQWADKLHGIFLCLTCAANYRQIKTIICIKSISLDVWNQNQLKLLLNSGNKRFKQFLMSYQIDHLEYYDKFRTKACQYYRLMLIEEINNKQIPIAPILSVGKQITKSNLLFKDMNTNEILDEAKDKAIWLGNTTKYYGSKAYQQIHYKITSGELKTDAKQIAGKVTTNAGYLWGNLKNQISTLTSPRSNSNNRNSL